MDPATVQFVRYREHGDVAALGRVFDELAPRLLALALHACGNAADAEDALQATFVVAMQKARAFDAQQSVGGWLAGILAGEARNLMRREQRRRGEPLVESAAEGGDPGAASERAELVARLRSHVEALPEEQRQVLLLQLQHGLQPAEIAEVLRVPPGTVRMRLHRGLAALRGMLPAGLAALVTAMLPSRGLAAVRAAVMHEAKAAAAVGAGVGGGAVVLLGGLLVKKVVGVVVLAVFGLLAWWGSSAMRDPVAAPGSIAAGAVDPIEASMPRDEHRSDSPDAVQPASPRAAIASPAGGLRVIVLGSQSVRTGRREWTATGWPGSGTPMADVLVEVWSGAAAPDDVDAHCVTARTDAEGHCTFLDLQPVEWNVALTIAGRHVGGCRAVVPAGAQADCELHLPSTADLQGRVIDSRGSPVAGATIVAGCAMSTQGQRSWRPRVVGMSRSDGSFRVVLTHEQLLGARKAGNAMSWSHLVEQPDDGPMVLQLGDEPGAIEVRVTDREGRAIPGTIVQVQSSSMESRRLDTGELVAPPLGVVADEVAPGRFVARDLAVGCYSVFVAAPGRNAQSQLQVTAGATVSMQMTFGAGVAVTGHVRGLDGAPLRGIYVSIERPGESSSQVLHTDSQGAFRFEGIAPGVVSLTAVRLGTQARVTKSVVVPGDRGIECDLELVDAPAIRGRIVDEKGGGLSEYMVAVQQGAHSHSCFADGDGSFTVFDLTTGAATFRVSNRQSGEEVARVDVETPRPDVPVRLVVPATALPHAELRGRIVRADGQPAAEPAASLREQPPAWWPTAQDDGTFHFEGLVRGDVTLDLRAAGCAMRTLRVQLAHGEQKDLGDLVLQPAGELRVRFVRPDGQPWRERPPVPQVTKHGDTSPLAVDSVDREVQDGVVVMTGLANGRYLVAGPAEDDLLVEPQVVDVVAGRATEVLLTTAVGRRLEFRIEEPAGIALLEQATIVVRRPDGVELARGDIAPAKQTLDAKLRVPMGDVVAEVVADGQVTHRSAFTVTGSLADRGLRTIPPLVTPGR